MKIKTEYDYERMEQIALAHAWMLSGTIKNGHSISVVATEIAKTVGIDWGIIRDIILDGLRVRSDEYYKGPGPELCEIGRATLGEWDIWWSHNGGSTEWYADRPDWWEEQIKQWAVND